MKKFLLFLTLLITMPAFGVCSIDVNNSICTIQDNGSSLPLFQNQNANNEKFKTSNEFKQSNLNNTFQQNQNKNGIDINSSMDCQFGNCNQGLNNPLIKNN